ncbi:MULTISPECIES: aldose 1-epimerase family protein [Micromonospora]|uniref:Aldose 1-epimerase n=1 Tax=Micromonospora rifamycinica TaxID=291594 RepID=A0A109IHQ7_9ACTN|nr:MULTISPECIES: aldose 1-epimerase family protein [Micromonospora]KWV30762.1 aldose epimerase [Micromonospora rifamycinica]WFE63630.1 aldose 1-epimerase family protein [Micromonospora sp. WMMD714]SCG66406.1 aldose 1-epimerase [Micromonospora rifamycinica]
MDNTARRPASGTQWTIAADGHEAVIVEVGGGVRTFRRNGVDYLDGYAEDEISPGSAGHVLAPWPNRIRDGKYTFGGRSLQLDLTEPARGVALHGLVNWVRWELVEESADAVTLGYDLPPTPGYPWPLRLRSRWSVGADGLRAEHEVTNTGVETAPFGFSVHPYLRLAGVAVDDLTMRLPARSRLQVDARLLPIGATPVAGTEYDWTTPRPIGQAQLDLCFGDVIRDDDGGSSVTLAAPDDADGVRLWADREFGWWQVFTGDALTGERHRRSVAVEPMTCPPDAFRSGRDVIELGAGQTWRGSWGIRPGA